MWPFSRKAVEPLARKSASFFLGMAAYTGALTNARFDQFAKEGFAENAVVNACITRIANATASVEPQLYRKDKSGKLTKVDAHPLLDLIESPNPAQSGKEFLRQLVGYYLTGGNAYVYGNGIDPNARKSKAPTELQLLNPGKMAVNKGPALFPSSYEYKPNATTSTLFQVNPLTGRSAILQYKTFNPLNQWYGLSPMNAAAFAIDIFNSGQKWNKRLLDNDARPSGALVVKDSEGKPASLSEDQYTRLKEMMAEQFSGSANAGRPILLEGGLEWQQMSMNAKDLDFMTGKASAARDIGLIYGVPGQLLGIPGDSTFANYEQANLSFWTDTVLPLYGVLLEGLNRWLTPLYGDDLYLWYDEEAIPALEPRRKERFDRLNTASFMKLDEKRKAVGEDELPNGIGDVIVIEGRGVLLNAKTGEIISLAPATPTTENGIDTPEPADPKPKDQVKHAAWLVSNGYTPERAGPRPADVQLMSSRRAAHAAFLAMMDRFEAQLDPKIVADKDAFIDKAATRYAEHGTPNFFDLVDKHQQAIFETLKDHYRKVIPAFAALSLSQVKSRQFKDDEEDSLFTSLANDWIHTEGLKRSHLIADTTEADVLAAISDGVDEGLGTSAIASAIRKVSDLSAFRSELIARTETHAAANYASVESVRHAENKLDVKMLKQWSPTIDGRTRPAHADMQGSDPIPMDDTFLVDGEELDRPGDPAGSPENTINCRCVLLYSESDT